MEQPRTRLPMVWLGRTVIVVFACWLLGFAWFFYEMFRPIEALRVESSSFIIASRLRPGDDLMVTFNACKLVDAAQGTVTLHLKGADVWLLPLVHASLAPGCYHTRVVVGTIPERAPPGEYVLVLNFHYKVNALRDASYHFETNRFVID